ncbi:MAG: cell division protein FtsA [Anaerolineales bacterium]|nr:cell division protein FtsA [Anaerolineales bacterium]MCB0011937.1 cell division protein FtsA [Anaerolineales bacterium]MCB8961649.1 cell division protein FtsA [Ardenticatenales bacterium]
MAEVIFGIDIGTTKICAVVGEVWQGQLRIIGLGIVPSKGVRKGMIVNAAEASAAIAKAVEKAEQTSGYDLSQAYINVAGEHIACYNNAGVSAINRNGSGVTVEDVGRALDAAQAIPVPRNRQVLHVIPQNFKVDNQGGVLSPLGMHGARLEVDAHIVTAATPALMNLTQCADNVGIQAEDFVLNALASGEAVLESTERNMGVIVADIGGGTTDIALYVDGSAWHTKVVPIGGSHITNDIAIGLRVPFEVAERVKLQYGDCRPDQIDSSFVFTVEPFSGEKIQVGRQDLASVIEARVEEMFQIVLNEIRESGYDGLLPAGIVLTGGCAQLRGIADVAQRVLGVPARVASPKNLVGLVDALKGPAYTTSIGLMRWSMVQESSFRPLPSQGIFGNRLKIGEFLRALLPG